MDTLKLEEFFYLDSLPNSSYPTWDWGVVVVDLSGYFKSQSGGAAQVFERGGGVV